MLEIMLGIGFIVVPAIVFTIVGMVYSGYKQYQEDKEKKLSTLLPLTPEETLLKEVFRDKRVENDTYKGYKINWENGIFFADDLKGAGIIMGKSIKDLVDQIDENEGGQNGS